ncbi:MAG: peptidoglycan DD-metalloendopeptidase family protein [Gemmatimonadaceae bacterium]|nr:peptidoglycan DD-metalloendopeptidase family protein [Gemmatimonadaceae bacterium]
MRRQATRQATRQRVGRLLLMVQVLIGVAVACPALLRAQSAEQRLRQQREELDAIRRERGDLQARLQELQGRAHDLADESQNLRRQAETTARLVRSLDTQLLTINADVDSTTGSLQRAEQEVMNRRLTLKHRLVDIYKRGPMYSTQALLSARTFGELVGRYKYLHELALRDRSVVRRVEDLYTEIDGQRALLLTLQRELQRNRTDKAMEEQRLRSLEGSRSRALAEVQESQQQITERLARIQRDEQRLTQLFATMEDTRKRNEARPNAPAPTTSTLKTSDFGKLAWPVAGEILYRFGRAINPNNTAIRWNGIGIQAPQGTAVRAIAGGEVMVADPIGTYGLTVIVQHGGGDYSVYGSLSRADVRKGDRLAAGDVLGAVGRADPDMEPHLHLEIRPKGRALDPLAWLSHRGDSR